MKSIKQKEQKHKYKRDEEMLLNEKELEGKVGTSCIMKKKGDIFCGGIKLPPKAKVFKNN